MRARRLGSFDMFARACENAGLVGVRHGGGHWQIQGGSCIVNYYPGSKRGSCYYVAGTKRSYRGGQGKAIRAANRVPPKVSPHNRDQRKQTLTRTVKRNLMKKDPRCHWCRDGLFRETATIDHRIPLARGGLDNANNMVLACEPCNKKRGSDMPELRARERNQ